MGRVTNKDVSTACQMETVTRLVRVNCIKSYAELVDFVVEKHPHLMPFVLENSYSMVLYIYDLKVSEL